MKIWTDSIKCNITDKTIRDSFTEQTLFFDIETTGFSPAHTTLYLIGCSYRKGDTIFITQYFAEKKEEEKQILSSFFEKTSSYDTFLSFNGLGFDVPYLKAKCEQFHLFDENRFFNLTRHIDFFQKTRSLKNLLKLPNYKQKTVEQFLNLPRKDTYHGGELIAVYKHFLKTNDTQSVFLLKQHNYEDVLQMTHLLSLFNYQKLIDGHFRIHSLETNLYRDLNGCCQKEILLSLQNESPIPKQISCQKDEFYLILDKNSSKLRIHLFDGVLKFFFEHPNEYYYLPEKDVAIHKSLVHDIEKKQLKKATASTCYTKKDAIFVPQYEQLQTPSFRKNYKDKCSYFELTENFLNSDFQLRTYVMHIFRHLLTK